MAGKEKMTSDSKVKKTVTKTPAPKKLNREHRSLQKKKENLYIVGVGASAGGLEAFQNFFKHMPKDTGMAFVLVPHLDPTHVSIMPELLQKYCRMPVREITDGMAVAIDTVYIVPSNKNLAILHGVLLVVFEEKPPAAVKKRAAGKQTTGQKPGKRLEVIEEELKYTKENLQITIEELETSNEELQSTNEELQSTNEELQSANEELETSKEEQQSLNEELVTVNAELQEKIDALTLANNDMHNLLDSVEVPTIFLDTQLKIKRFTTQATEVINVIDTDIGRPLHHIASKLNYEQLAANAQDVLKTLVHKEIQVQTKEGRWYLMRILPYRTVDNVINGVVIIFMDTHEQRMAHEHIENLNQMLKEQSAYAESIIATLREPMLVLDSKLNIVSTNPAFYAKFQVLSGDIAGRNIFELQNRQWDIPGLKELLDKVAAEGRVMEDFPIEHTFKKIGQRKLQLNARKIERKKGKENLVLLVFEDVTTNG